LVGASLAVIPDCREAASPESITTIGAELSPVVNMDSGLAPIGAPRNDDYHSPKIALAMICF
jgi:hypothetical protein